MRDETVDCLCATIFKRLCSKRHGVSGINHIVNENRNLVANIANKDMHRFGFSIFPLAVDERELYPELVSDRSSTG